MLHVSLLILAIASDDARAAAHCEDCQEWNRPQRAFLVFGNTYYVGTRGLTAVLITSGSGHVLIDGALPQSAPLIEANIRALGFRVEDVKLILNTHAHFDHAGGIAALQLDTGARVAASASGAQALRDGHPTSDDPQFGPGPEPSQHFARVPQVQSVGDGETLRVGDLAITAVATPGHTPGSMSWTWKSCEGNRCVDVVYADSLTPIAGDGFRYTGDAKHPDISDSFARSIARVTALPCDILLSPHPDASDTFDKLVARARNPNAFIRRNGCRTYAALAAKRLQTQLSKERAPPVQAKKK